MRAPRYSAVLLFFLLTVGGMSGMDLGSWLHRQNRDLPGAETIVAIGMLVGCAGSVLVYCGCMSAIRRLTTHDVTDGPAADYDDHPPAP